MSVNFLLWNCRAISEKKHVLDYFVNNLDIKISCLVEIHLKVNYNFNFYNYNNVSLTRKNNRKEGGVTILIHKDLKYECLNKKHNNFIKYCIRNGVEILIPNIFINPEASYNLFVVYSPPRGSNSKKYTKENFWNKFVTYTDNFENTILCRDFNALHENWDNTGKENRE